MAGSSKRRRSRVWWIAAVLSSVIVWWWFFLPVRVKPLPSAATGSAAAANQFDSKASAKTFWNERLTPAIDRAAGLAAVVRAVRHDPTSARKSFGKPAGVGADYFFLRGSGKVVARERNVLRVTVDGASPEVVALRLGPIFGNTVRDGSGLLDVNAYPGLQEFNALAAELNALVEQQVLPVLREQANVGATVEFAGCAVVPEFAEEPGEPLFTVVPVRAEVR